MISLNDLNDSERTWIIFINDNIKEPVLCLYRITEKTASMSHLWKSFICETQNLRNQIEVQTLDSFLIEEKIKIIDLKNNAHIFSSLVTSKNALRFKDNVSVVAQVSRIEEIFAFAIAIAIISKVDELKSRAKMCRVKTTAFSKQILTYDKAADTLKKDKDTHIDATVLKTIKMTYLSQDLLLSCKELHHHITAHKTHLIAVTEKLQEEMSILAAFVHRAEKSLRNKIQLKIVADLKLLRDIKCFDHFEL